MNIKKLALSGWKAQTTQMRWLLFSLRPSFVRSENCTKVNCSLRLKDFLLSCAAGVLNSFLRLWCASRAESRRNYLRGGGANEEVAAV
jgi:hypothetical protein